MNTIDAFLALVDRYGAFAGVAEATVSSRLFNDGKRIASIRRGSDVGVRRLLVALEWLSDHWPDDAEWPELVPRPQSQSPVGSSSGKAGASSPPNPQGAPAISCQGRAEVARLAHNQGVAGSNPAPASSFVSPASKGAGETGAQLPSENALCPSNSSGHLPSGEAGARVSGISCAPATVSGEVGQ